MEVIEFGIERKHLSKRLCCGLLLLCIITIIVIPACAANEAVDFVTVKNTPSASFSDIAVTELTLYGFFDDEYLINRDLADQQISRLDSVMLLYNIFGGQSEIANHLFSDVPKEYDCCVSWAYNNGITNGVGNREFGIGAITEQAFVAMLLRYMGYRDQFNYNESIEFAKSIGLIIPNVEDSFDLGKAALYVVTVLDMKRKGADTEIRNELDLEIVKEKPGHPLVIRIYPGNEKEFENDFVRAFRYLPKKIEVYMDHMDSDTYKAIYEKYDRISKARMNKEYTEETFIDLLSFTTPKNSILIKTQFRYNKENSDEYNKAYIGVMDSMQNGLLSYDEMLRSLDELKMIYEDMVGPIEFSLYYTNTYLLANGDESFFSTFVDDSMSKWIAEVYSTAMDPVKDRSDYEKIMAAKKAICNLVSYDYSIYSGNNSNYLHSISGAYLNRKVVCDGYSNLFMYFMSRSGVPCFEVLGKAGGSSETAGDSEEHSWIKVRLDGKWYNMDICWADTSRGGITDTYDLKSDKTYNQKKHWARDYQTGVFSAAENYR